LASGAAAARIVRAVGIGHLEEDLLERPFRGEPAAQLFDGAGGDELPAVDDADAGAEALAMCRRWVERKTVLPAAAPARRRSGPRGRRGIEAVGRLVEDQHVGSWTRAQARPSFFFIPAE